jgi:hypothetical protein
LPSKGLIYPKDHPLSSGKVEIKYMTAKEEDILSNQSYIQKGIVLEKLLRSVIVNKSINVDDLIIGDKNALLIATRILGYGKEYKVTIAGQDESIDLSTRLKFMILSIDGNDDKKFVREFVDNSFLARDSRAFRSHVADTQPDVDLKYITESGEEVTVPIGLSFFWPDF